MPTLDEQKIEIPPNITWGFGWARNGGEIGRLFQRALVEGGVKFTYFSYSDTRDEWDLWFEYEGKQFRGFAGTGFEFSRVGVSYLEGIGYVYSGEGDDPPTLETVLYRVFSALKGERYDGRVIEGTPIQWYKLHAGVERVPIQWYNDEYGHNL